MNPVLKITTAFLLFINLNCSSQSADSLGGLTKSIYTDFWQHPAFTGNDGRINFSTGFTAYYLGIRGPKPYEYFFTFDGAFGKKKNFAMGALFSKGHNYTSKITLSDIFFSGKLKLSSKTFLRMGMAVSPFYRNVTTISEGEILPDMVHPVFGPIYPTTEVLVGDSSIIKIKGGLKCGLWIQSSHFFSGLSLKNINLVTTVITRFHDTLQTFSNSPNLLFFNTSGYTFALNKYSITPVLNSIYIKNAGFSLGINVTGTFKNKHFITIGSSNNFSMVSVSLGSQVVRKLRIILSSAFYTNTYLYKITGMTFLNLNLQFHL